MISSPVHRLGLRPFSVIARRSRSDPERDLSGQCGALDCLRLASQGRRKRPKRSNGNRMKLRPAPPRRQASADRAARCDLFGRGSRLRYGILSPRWADRKAGCPLIRFEDARHPGRMTGTRSWMRMIHAPAQPVQTASSTSPEAGIAVMDRSRRRHGSSALRAMANGAGSRGERGGFRPRLTASRT